MMHRRTDSWHEAGYKRAILLGARVDPRIDGPPHWDQRWLDMVNDGNFAVAEPGDVWQARVDSHLSGVTTSYSDDVTWPIGGYVLVCPLERCQFGAHLWTHASDCPGRSGGTCKRGGADSCWRWSGSIEDGDLTAEPSLYIPAVRGGCGWHGYLIHGEMVGIG
jgi:hypothetical protein